MQPPIQLHNLIFLSGQCYHERFFEIFECFVPALYQEKQHKNFY